MMIHIEVKRLNESLRIEVNMRLHRLLYKVLGTLLISGVFFFVHFWLFQTPRYGDVPFFILLSVCLGTYLILPRFLDKLVLSAAIALYAIYNVVQVCYFKLFDQYLFISTAFSLFNEAKDYSSDAFDLITGKEWTVLIVSAAAIVLLWVIRGRKANSWKEPVICLLGGLLAFGIAGILALKQEKMIVELGNDVFIYNQSDRYVYDKIAPKKTFVECFGIESFLYRDLKDNYFINHDELEESYQRIEEFMSENLPYEENERTGMFAGKQLILIEAESLNMAAIDEKLTPTLYQLLNEGWFFDNFYSPTMTGSTSDVETMVNLSLLPINTGVIVSQAYADNTYPVTLAKIFSENGYCTNAYHNNFGVFYNRENYFPALGYENFFDCTKMTIESASSDKIVGDKIQWIQVYNELDFSFWVTYSGHQPYLMESLDDTVQYPGTVRGEYLEYIEQVQNCYPDLDENAQLYLAKNMSLDAALREYLNTYIWMQRLDDIVIVIYGDHEVKMYDPDAEEQTIEMLNRSMNDTPLIIWSSEIEHEVIDKYCTDIDLLPTLCNLFGLSYDKTAVLGNDIFDERYHGFQFTTDWTVSTDDFVYSTQTGEFVELNIDETEARQILSRYLDYQEISNLIYQIDYYKLKEEMNQATPE